MFCTNKSLSLQHVWLEQHPIVCVGRWVSGASTGADGFSFGARLRVNAFCAFLCQQWRMACGIQGCSKTASGRPQGVDGSGMAGPSNTVVILVI
jgi:hypothetical protein